MYRNHVNACLWYSGRLRFEYLKIGASIALECMKFALGDVEIFGEEYLRKPNQVDVNCLLQVAKARDFPCILVSINCML